METGIFTIQTITIQNGNWDPPLSRFLTDAIVVLQPHATIFTRKKPL